MNDNSAHRFPVSVKGVCVQNGLVLLLRNERAEWELPGGKLELGEAPDACVAREIAEEAGWDVRVGDILDSWQYHIREGVDVLIVTYGCYVDSTTEPVVSHEHKEAGLFALDQVDGLPMPQGYRNSVRNWFARLAPTEPATGSLSSSFTASTSTLQLSDAASCLTTGRPSELRAVDLPVFCSWTVGIRSDRMSTQS